MDYTGVLSPVTLEYMSYMKFKQLMAACFVLAGVLQGCSGLPPIPGLPGMAKPRNKMPDPGIPGGGAFTCTYASPGNELVSGYDAGLLDLSLEGNGGAWLAVPLTDASFDSLAFNLAETYRPVAQMMINQWAGQNNSGIMLDLRTGHPGQQRATFSVENPVRNFPVMLLWDQGSAFRSNAYLRVLQTVPGIKAVSGPGCFQ